MTEGKLRVPRGNQEFVFSQEVMGRNLLRWENGETTETGVVEPTAIPRENKED